MIKLNIQLINIYIELFLESTKAKDFIILIEEF
jgi:hypothetical protein